MNKICTSTEIGWRSDLHYVIERISFSAVGARMCNCLPSLTRVLRPYLPFCVENAASVSCWLTLLVRCIGNCTIRSIARLSNGQRMYVRWLWSSLF